MLNTVGSSQISNEIRIQFASQSNPEHEVQAKSDKIEVFEGRFLVAHAMPAWNRNENRKQKKTRLKEVWAIFSYQIELTASREIEREKSVQIRWLKKCGPKFVGITLKRVGVETERSIRGQKTKKYHGIKSVKVNHYLQIKYLLQILLHWNDLQWSHCKTLTVKASTKHFLPHEN